MSATSSPVRPSQHIADLLDRLHQSSLEQEESIPPAKLVAVKELYKTDPVTSSLALDDLMRDKFIALDRDKAEFVYQLVISSRSRYIVEAGTSYGVSTIYLALAVAEVEKLTGEKGWVIATEKEPEKAKKARENWEICGNAVAERINLREGDLEETLANDIETVDFLLLDIWPPVALPALKAVLPRLKPGALVVTDNTIQSASRYEELFSVLRDPKGNFRSSTLPFKGGLEVSVYMPEK
ncbi:O-methyltransferase [Patellaria atrata CBS 101060]|uniref:O-methyltransferase n=1 Tax=Patellaria atrata CBS 101060 TaxID=1346257 RepID=A0A9P4S3M6_9PEZI|nr:O-methyltransferase [Patellaria atrata CBS 101060]